MFSTRRTSSSANPCKWPHEVAGAAQREPVEAAGAVQQCEPVEAAAPAAGAAQCEPVEAAEAVAVAAPLAVGCGAAGSGSGSASSLPHSGGRGIGLNLRPDRVAV